MRKDVLAMTAVAAFIGTATQADTYFENEPNDTMAEAEIVGLLGNGDQIRANHETPGLDIYGTFDWFKITLPDLGGLWTIESLQAPDGPGDGIADTWLFLHDEFGDYITDNDDGGLLDPDTPGYGLSKLTGIAPGTYFLGNEGWLGDDDVTGVDYIVSFSTTSVPAPGAMALLGLAGAIGIRRRRR